MRSKQGAGKHGQAKRPTRKNLKLWRPTVRGRPMRWTGMCQKVVRKTMQSLRRLQQKWHSLAYVVHRAAEQHRRLARTAI